MSVWGSVGKCVVCQGYLCCVDVSVSTEFNSGIELVEKNRDENVGTPHLMQIHETPLSIKPV